MDPDLRRDDRQEISLLRHSVVLKIALTDMGEAVSLS